MTGGIAFLVSHEDSALVAFARMLVGSAFVVRFGGPDRMCGEHGPGAASVSAVNAADATDLVLSIVFGFAASACVAEVGGRIGRWLRPKHRELPGAKVHGSRDQVS